MPRFVRLGQQPRLLLRVGDAGDQVVPVLVVRGVVGAMPRELLSRRRHTHHALDDAIKQAELFGNLMMWEPAPQQGA